MDQSTVRLARSNAGTVPVFTGSLCPALALAAAVAALSACGVTAEDTTAPDDDRAVTQTSEAISLAGVESWALGQRMGGIGLRSRRVVFFGDSLSDVGTYRVGPIAAAGGGKFTVNPAPVWSELVGLALGSPVTPYRVGLAGVSTVLGGAGFAMGGARVTQQPGIGCDPEPATGACRAWLTIPVTQQIGDYLGANRDHFDCDQIVFVLAGANDVIYQLGVFQAEVEAGVSVAQAQSDALAGVLEAARELVAQVELIKDKGAKRVALLNVPDLSDTPFGTAPEMAPVRPLIAAMVQSFNQTIAAGVRGRGVELLDLAALEKDVVVNPGKYHIKDVTTAACDVQKIEQLTSGAITDGLSLFCSGVTLTSADAPLTHLFADYLHPSTIGHAVIARFVLFELLKRGMLR